MTLSQHERELVSLVAEFVDEEVRPRVAELESEDRYPEARLEQMKRLGFFGLLVPQSTAAAPSAPPASHGSPRSCPVAR